MTDFGKATPGPWHIGGPHFGRYDVWAQEPLCARQSIAVMHAFGKKGGHYGDMFAANAALIADAGTVWGATGKAPSQLATELAASQAEVARLRGALKACGDALDTCTPGDYSTGHVIAPYFDEDAVNAALGLLDGLNK